MRDIALDEEIQQLRDQVARLEAARGPSVNVAGMQGFQQLNDAIVENRLGTFLRDKSQPRWLGPLIGLVVGLPLLWIAVLLASRYIMGIYQ